MKRLRQIYLNDKDENINIVRNLYQSFFIVAIYNGIANRSTIEAGLVYLFALIILISAIYISMKLLMKRNQKAIKLSGIKRKEYKECFFNFGLLRILREGFSAC